MAELAHVKGLAELQKKLMSLSGNVRNKVLRKAVLAGAGIIRREAVRIAPVSKGPRRRGKGRIVAPGTLRRAIRNVYAREKSNENQVTYLVTVRKGKREQKRDRDAYYASWVEFGHKFVPRRSKGKLLGQSLSARRKSAISNVPPHRYLAPSFESKKLIALSAMNRKMETELRKIIQT